MTALLTLAGIATTARLVDGIGRRHRVRTLQGIDLAVEEGGTLGPYVAVAMIEAAVNSAVDETSHEDVVDMLRDLANQVEEDADAEEDD